MALYKNIIKPVLRPLCLTNVCLLGGIFTQSAVSFQEVPLDIGLEKIEAQKVDFQQAHLCPYPIELNVKIFNNLKIAGMKRFSYRWIINGEILETNGRFEVYPSAYGVGYDIRKTIVHVGQAPENAEDEENSSKFNKLLNVFDKENPQNSGWYQFLALPAGETDWHDAVKSNKAIYKINCKT